MNKLYGSLLAAVCFHQAPAFALPAHQDFKTVQQDFSLETQNQFYLYADTLDDNLVWYISKQSTISNENNNFNAPQFAIGTAQDPQSQQEFTWIRGAFDVRGSQMHLRELENEAHQLGYRIALAPLHIKDAHIYHNGMAINSLTQKCKDIVYGHQKYPLCEVFDAQGEKVEDSLFNKIKVKTDDYPYFSFRLASHVSYNSIFTNLMGLYNEPQSEYNGVNWDGVFHAEVLIKVATYQEKNGTEVLYKQNNLNTKLSIQCLEGGWREPVEWVHNKRCSTKVPRPSQVINLNTDGNIDEQIEVNDALSPSEAEQRVKWSEKCHHLSEEDARFALYRRLRTRGFYKRTQPFYYAYVNDEQTQLWKAPIIASKPCSRGPGDAFDVYPELLLSY